MCQPVRTQPLKIDIKAGPPAKPKTVITKLARDTKLEQAARAARPLPETPTRPITKLPTPAKGITVRPISAFAKVPEPAGLFLQR